MVLGLLATEGKLTGSQINDTADKWLSPFWTTTRSQVYRELNEMASEKLVTPGNVGPRNAVPYKITRAGRVHLSNWMDAEPDTDLLRNQVALRVMLGGMLTKVQMVKMVASAKAKHEQLEAECLAKHKEAREHGFHADAAAIYFGVMYHRLVITWLDNLDLRSING